MGDYGRQNDSSELGRTYQINGVANFRDVGLCSKTTARNIRWGLVFRSADPSALTTEGKAKLQALGICKIFDLRRLEEIKDGTTEGSVYESWLSSENGPERAMVPIFNDADFAPDALAARLLGYSDASTKVGISKPSRNVD